jgi:hypothetical protein
MAVPLNIIRSITHRTSRHGSNPDTVECIEKMTTDARCEPTGARSEGQRPQPISVTLSETGMTVGRLRPPRVAVQLLDVSRSPTDRRQPCSIDRRRSSGWRYQGRKVSRTGGRWPEMRTPVPGSIRRRASRPVPAGGRSPPRWSTSPPGCDRRLSTPSAARPPRSVLAWSRVAGVGDARQKQLGPVVVHHRPGLRGP